MTTTEVPTVQQQATMLLPQVAGYIGHRTVAMGLRQGLVAALAEYPDGLTAEELAAQLGLDRFYVEVWLRAAHRRGDPGGWPHHPALRRRRGRRTLEPP